MHAGDFSLCCYCKSFLVLEADGMTFRVAEPEEFQEIPAVIQKVMAEFIQTVPNIHERKKSRVF